MAIGTTRSRRGLDAPSDLVIYGRVLSRAIDVHPKQITDWKDQLVELAAEVFERGSNGKASAPAVDIKALHAKIGELTLEKDFLEAALGKAGLPSARR